MSSLRAAPHRGYADIQKNERENLQETGARHLSAGWKFTAWFTTYCPRISPTSSPPPSIFPFIPSITPTNFFRSSDSTQLLGNSARNQKLCQFFFTSSFVISSPLLCPHRIIDVQWPSNVPGERINGPAEKWFLCCRFEKKTFFQIKSKKKISKKKRRKNPTCRIVFSYHEQLHSGKQFLFIFRAIYITQCFMTCWWMHRFEQI